MFAYDVKFLN